MLQTQTQPPAVAASPRVTASAVLRQKLAAVRLRSVVLAMASGAATLLMVGSTVLLAALLLDWWFDFPIWLRAVLLAGYLAGFGWMLFVKVCRPWVRQPDDETVALMIERACPEFRTRFIAAVQLTRPDPLLPDESSLLVRSLVKETETLAETLKPSRVVKADSLKINGRNAFLMTLIALTALIYWRESTGDLVRRLFLSGVEVPRKTRVEVVNGDKLIGRGDNVNIIVRARGIVPRTGTLLLTHASGQEEEFPLEADPQDAGKFVKTLENVQDSFTYRVKLNDNLSPRYKVESVPRPEVSHLECYQVFPPYTKLGTVRRPLGDLALLAGSKLQVRATASKEVVKGFIKLVGLDQEVPLELNPQNRKELTASISVLDKGLTGISIGLEDWHGVQSRDSAVYRVDILPDAPPAVKITYPERKEDLVTRQATVLIGFEASDDFAVAKVFLRYKIDTIGKGMEKAIELDLGGEQPKSLRRRYEWVLPNLMPIPNEGSVIEYWLEVHDANDISGPGITQSEHYVVKVVSENEKRADLMSRVTDYLGGISGVVKDQETLNRTLGNLIRGKGQ